MTQAWMSKIAEPRFARFLEEATQETGDLLRALRIGVLDPIDITYFILDGQVPRVPFRDTGDGRLTFLELQSKDQSKNNYFADGATLELARRVHDKVKDTVAQIEQRGARANFNSR